MFLLIKKEWYRSAVRRVADWLPIIVTELVIVFVGVYAAEVVTDAREERERTERQQQIVDTIINEISPFLSASSNLIADIRSGYDAWVVSSRSGTRPPPYFMMATFEMSMPHPALWEATLETGGFDLLDVDTLAKISDFYARTNRLVERYRRLNDFVQREVFPRLDSDPSAFYLDDNRTLRPMFRVYAAETQAAIVFAEETLSIGGEIYEAFQRQD